MHARMGPFAVLLAIFLAATMLVSEMPVSDAADTEYVDGLPVYKDAKVTPFTFPESKGTPIMEALDGATESIEISIYLISSSDVVGLLCEKQSQGVNVQVLVFGKPLGVDVESEMRMLLKLDSEGADVRVIDNSVYPYLHNKYAVIDDDTVVITSENWASSNINKGSNRGWGAIIESEDYAEYMDGIFDGDYDVSRSDVKYIEDAYPDLEPYAGEITYTIRDFETQTYTADVSPVVSPQTSFSAMKAFMATADERLYVEELDLSTAYSKTGGDTPAAWMSEAASAGADTRFVLNATYDEEGEGSYLIVEELNSTTKIKASTINGGTGFKLTHNKGIIADDAAWVGSVNLTESSMTKNRESAVIIYSQEVSDYYAGFFLTDFSNNYTAGTRYAQTFVVDGESTVRYCLEGDVITLPATPTKASDDKYDYTFSHWEGYTEGMTATQDNTFTAVFEKSENGTSVPWYYILIVVAVIIIGAVLKATTSKKKHRRSYPRSTAGTRSRSSGSRKKSSGKKKRR